jgi:hypothetical protein
MGEGCPSCIAPATCGIYELEGLVMRILEWIAMSMRPTTVTIVLGGTLLTTGTLAQNANAVTVSDPYRADENEPAPGLIVDAPDPESLAAGAVQIQYRAENEHFFSAFGTDDLNESQRISHLYITVDDLPLHWAGASDAGTIDIVGLLPGDHRVSFELVDTSHKISLGQSANLTFTVPNIAPHSHRIEDVNRLEIGMRVPSER